MGSCQSQQYDSNEVFLPIGNLDTRIQPVVKPTTGEFEEIVFCMMKSYQGDQYHAPNALWNFWFGQEHAQFDSLNRRDLFDHYSRFYLNFALRYGVVYVTRDPTTKNICAVALMLPSGVMESGKYFTCCRQMGIEKMTGKSPAVKNPTVFGKDIQKRIDLTDSQSASTRSKIFQENQWHLLFLGVRPEYQHKSFGTALVQLFGKLHQQDKVPGSLDCVGEKNKNFFLRNGFQVVSEETFVYKSGDKEQKSEVCYYMQKK